MKCVHCRGDDAACFSCPTPFAKWRSDPTRGG